jgi:hypothetical protein
LSVIEHINRFLAAPFNKICYSKSMHSTLLSRFLLGIIGSALLVAFIAQGAILIDSKTKPSPTLVPNATDSLTNGTSLPLMEIPLAVGATKSQGNKVITNQTQWKLLWSELTQNSEQPLPEVDFTHDMVIAVFSGQKPRGGYSTRIDAINETDTEYHVLITELRPSDECITTQEISSPLAIVKVAKSNKKVVYTTKDTTFSCQNDQGFSELY